MCIDYATDGPIALITVGHTTPRPVSAIQELLTHFQHDSAVGAAVISGNFAFDDPAMPPDLDRAVPGGKPVIAAIEGVCAADGLALALGCDLRLCAPDATFVMPVLEAAPVGAAANAATHLVGVGHALELLLSGESFDAEWAVSTGLVDAMAGSGAVTHDARVLAERAALSGMRPGLDRTVPHRYSRMRTLIAA
ncbi:enoyl-CoA hydratase/isomerase family protein [Microbacterium gorillae]|uniref:enoyl-CoA hydratase/isomerase family protein n=1 Tax=Microbacterium gorillae TaxID=1231063 RepID=UPI0006947DA8|nr:enoyl-CoA hydratase/isomerase family protein [Microbacterium gorillae]